MSETNTTSAIDQMVAASVNGTPIVRPNTTADMRLDFEGNFTQLAPAAHAAAVVDSPGLDLGAEVEGIDSNIARIEAELSEQRFDAKTGKATFVREGKERTDRETQLASLNAAREYQVRRNQDLQAKRDAEAAAKATADREAAARHAFTQGSPERAAALAKAISEEEAREAARAIVAGRRG